jgi:hypothetical protein
MFSIVIATAGAMTSGRKACIRLFAACLASLLVYTLAFGFVLDRPLALGFLQQQLDMKLERAAAIDGRKLVILAGSNGPYSHRCQVIEPIIAMPCVNGGVAVGIGLDYLFARWQDRLHAGDIVYLPMETAQYIRRRSATDLGPDAAIMFRHDWHTLAALPPLRWGAALFSFDLRAALMGPIETALLLGNFHDPRAAETGTTNAWGDHVGHSLSLAAESRLVLAQAEPHHPSAPQIATGYGSALIVQFTRWAVANGITVIGGLPTEFSDTPISDPTIAAIRLLYLRNGGAFLQLPNSSRYPRSAFFDTAEHLNQPWQIIHSIAVAEGLARLLRLRSITVDVLHAQQ